MSFKKFAMQIKPINTINTNKIKSNVNNHKYYVSGYSISSFTTDTVSFGSRAAFKPKDMMSYMPRAFDCKNAEYAAVGAQAYLDKHVGERIKSSATTVVLSSKEKVPSFEYYSNIKSGESILEKVVSKYAKISKKEDEEFANQLTNLLMAGLLFDEDVDRNIILSDVNYAISSTQQAPKKPPYKHIEEYVNAVRQRLTDRKRIDMSRMTLEDVDSSFKYIIEDLHLSNREDKEENYRGKFYKNPATMEGIKHYANDIVRCRIVMNVPDKSSTSDVISILSDLALKGEIKIKSIENYLPDENMLPHGDRLSKYEYISEKRLIDLAEDAKAKYIRLTSETGYLGVHINLDLTNSSLGSKNAITNGFQGEIQLIGRDVMKLKDVEDICYKIKDNKNSFNKKYLPLREHFLKYYNAQTQKAFDQYTYALYLYQRALPQNADNKKFPTIAQLGFKNRVPEELDFNLLAAMKEVCDARAEVLSNVANYS